MTQETSSYGPLAHMKIKGPSNSIIISNAQFKRPSLLIWTSFIGEGCFFSSNSYLGLTQGPSKMIPDSLFLYYTIMKGTCDILSI